MRSELDSPPLTFRGWLVEWCRKREWDGVEWAFAVYLSFAATFFASVLVLGIVCLISAYGWIAAVAVFAVAALLWFVVSVIREALR